MGLSLVIGTKLMTTDIANSLRIYNNVVHMICLPLRVEIWDDEIYILTN